MCNLSSPCEVVVTTSNLEEKYKEYYQNIKYMQQDKESMQQNPHRPKNQPKKGAKDVSNNITHYDIIDQMSIEMIRDLRKDNILDDYNIMQKKLTEDDLIK